MMLCCCSQDPKLADLVVDDGSEWFHAVDILDTMLEPDGHRLAAVGDRAAAESDEQIAAGLTCSIGAGGKCAGMWSYTPAKRAPKGSGNLLDLVRLGVERVTAQHQDAVALRRSASATIDSTDGLPKMTRFIAIKTIGPDCMGCLTIDRNMDVEQSWSVMIEAATATELSAHSAC